MDYYEISDRGILKELGGRIRAQRLNVNISQKALAARAGVSLKVVQNIEYGNASTITGFIRLMRAMRVLEQLDVFLPIARFSPIEIVKLMGKRPRRASRTK